MLLASQFLGALRIDTNTNGLQAVSADPNANQKLYV